MSYSSEVLADSPLRYWKLDESAGSNATDTASAVTGSYVGSPTLSQTGIAGTATTAVRFAAGSTQYFFGPISGLTTAFSLEFWYKYDGTANPVLWRDQTGSNGWLMLLGNTNADLTVRANGGTDRVITGVGTALVNGSWHQVVLTSSGTELKTYIDGALVDTWTKTVAASTITTRFNFARNGTNSQYYNSYYDEVSVYGAVLSASRVQIHYAQGSGTGSTTVNGGTATETDTAQAGSIVTGLTVVGGIASTAATIAAGTVLIGSLVVGGQATETDTALAGTAAQGQIVSGGTATQTSTAQAGTVVAGSVIAGGQATQTSTALAGSIAQTVTGGTANETDTAAAGAVVYTIVGGQAGETDTAAHGTVLGAGEVIVGGTAVETDSALAGTVTVGYIAGDTSDRDDGLDLNGTADVFWEPAVVTTPTRYRNLLAMDTVRAIVLNGIGPAGQPLISISEARAVKTRDRILLGGIDITYFRGVNTPTPDFTLNKPLLWGSGRLTLPQVSAQYEKRGPSDDVTDPVMRRLKRDASVVVQRVDADDNVVATDYVGFIDSFDTSGPTLSCVLAGHASGRLARQEYVPNPVFRRKHDLGEQALGFLRLHHLRTDKTNQNLSIPMYDRGGTDGLTHFNELNNFAVKRDGTSYVVMPDEDSRVYGWQEIERETVDFTFYLDSVLIDQQLQEAFSEQVDAAYVTARSNRGEMIGFIDLPGLTQGEIPPFPGLLEVGSTGDDVLILNEQLTIMDFLEFDELDDPSIYDDDTADAIRAVQRKAGLTRTGEVNEATWRVVWNEQRLGAFSIDRARQVPAAEKDWVDAWLRNTDGSKLARNPDFDPHRYPASRLYDLGTGWNQRRAQRYGESRLTPDDETNWQGTVTFTGGVIVGEHEIGDPVTADMVRSPRWIRPGMNGLVRYFDGDTLLHVSGTDFRAGSGGSPDQVVAMVDTLARNTMELAEVIARDKETRSKANPVRSWSGATRASSVHSDTLTDWIRKMGRLAHDEPLVAGWNRVMIPAGQEGVIQKIRAQLDDPAEFAIAITQGKSSVAAWNSRVPAPLSTPVGRPWYEREALTPWFNAQGLLVAWGTAKQPGGYDPTMKTDEDGPTGESPTGLFIEWGGFNYVCAKPGRLYLWIWVASSNTLLKGRILTQQLTSPV